ncbi:hypothetical protein [Mesorhizobium sp.]|uniref:hypothetical protein n=1 Tax=Mesorhizobium sp. TaxID=1871066 RepID=UPI0025D73D9E|nr:hypothetical protein [Mesorhizobium sp.]
MVGQRGRHKQTAIGREARRGDQFVEIVRQLTDNTPLDVQFEQIAKTDTGDGKGDDDRYRRSRPEPETDRIAHQSGPSGTK